MENKKLNDCEMQLRRMVNGMADDVVNGKMKFLLELSKTLSTSDIEKEVLNNTKTIKLLQGKPHKKVIVVPNKIVNIVI